MNKETKKYLKDVQSLFPTNTKDNRKYYKRFKESVIKETNGTDMTYDDCVNIFGTPKEVMLSYYNDLDSEIIINSFKKQHLFKKLFYLCTATVITILLISCLTIYNAYVDAKESVIYSCESEISIVE